MSARLRTCVATGLLLLASACNSPRNQSAAANDAAPATPLANDSNATENVAATPLPLHERDAAGAERVVERVIALATSGQIDAIRPLIRSGRDVDKQIARGRQAYADHPDARIAITGPGVSEGAAGSIYVTVPVAVTYAGPSGAMIRRTGTVTLRRVNDMPGATEEQLSWRLVDAKLDPAGK